MTEEAKIVEQLVVLFPTVAAWLIVGLVALIAAGGAMAVKKFMARLDTQDNTLNKIAELLASEIGKLRDKDHAIETRVVRIETHVGIDAGPKWGRRAADSEGAE
jgi:hypothetical protein